MSTEGKTPNFCSTCGNRITIENAKFCSTCGARLVGAESSEQGPVGSESSAVDQNQPESDPKEGAGGSPPSAPGTQQPHGVERGPTPRSQPATPVGGFGQGGTGTGSGAMGGQQTGQTQQQSFGYPTAQEKNLQNVNDVRPYTGSWATRGEMIAGAFFSGVAILAHFLKYFLIFNSFPSVSELLLPIPFYAIGVFLMLFFQKYQLRNAGIKSEMTNSNFDYSLSLFFSTFFLTLLPFRLKPDFDESNLQSTLLVPVTDGTGSSYTEMAREKYVGTKVRPKLYLYVSLFALILALLSIYYYFTSDNLAVVRTMKLVTMFFGGFVVVEIGPVFGRHYEESSNHGKYRTLLLSIFGILVTLSALFGPSFFAALPI